MSLSALRCGLAALFGLGATIFSLSSAQTPVLPDASLAERAIEPSAELTAAPSSVLKAPVQDAMYSASSTLAQPFRETTAKPSVNTPVANTPVKVPSAATPIKPSSSALAPKATPKAAPLVRPSSTPAPNKTNKISKATSDRPVMKPTTTVRYVRASSARSYVVRSTAYNSTPGQTDGSPHITATGTRTRFGVVALSRDLLGSVPYGSRIRIQDLSGTSYNRMLAGTIFIVEDTMNARMRRKVDVWMSTRSQALNWGSRSIRITVVN